MSDLKKINSNIRRIRTNGNKLNALIHDTGMLILAHVQEHRNATCAQQLVMAMPASMRRTALITWFERYSPIVVKNSADFNGKMQKEGSKNYTPFNLDGANEEPFWKIAQDTPEKEYSFDKLLELAKAMGKRIKKKIEEGHVPASDKTQAMILATTLETLSIAPTKGKAAGNSNEEVGEKTEAA